MIRYAVVILLMASSAVNKRPRVGRLFTPRFSSGPSTLSSPGKLFRIALAYFAKSTSRCSFCGPSALQSNEHRQNMFVVPGLPIARFAGGKFVVLGRELGVEERSRGLMIDCRCGSRATAKNV